MESRIEVLPLYIKDGYTSEEILNYKLKCKYLTWFFKGNFKTDIHILVEIVFRHYVVNSSLNDVLVKCTSNRQLENDFRQWIKKNESLWYFILDKRIVLKQENIILLPEIVSLKRTQENTFIIGNFHDKKQMEYEDYKEAINEFKSFM